LLWGCVKSPEREIIVQEIKILQTSAGKNEFSAKFDIENNLLTFGNIDLISNLEGYGTIYINDTVVFQGKFAAKSETNCKRNLKQRDNSIKVIFEDSIDCKSSILDNFKLIGWEIAKIHNADFHLTSLTEKRAVYNAEIIIESTLDVVSNLDIIVNQKHLIKLRDLFLTKGINKQSVSFNIQNPKLWWLNGLGDPDSYKITVNINIPGQIKHEYSQKLCIRTLSEINKQADIVNANCFRFNGKTVFLKGLEFNPIQSSVSDSDLIYYTRFVDFAKQIHANLIYSKNMCFPQMESFKNLCDENGILFYTDTLNLPLSINIFDINNALKKDELSREKTYFSQVVQFEKIIDDYKKSRVISSTCGYFYRFCNEHIPKNYLEPFNYSLKSILSTCIVVPVINGKNIQVYVVNDEIKEIDGILLCRLVDFYGKDYFVKQIPVSIKANSLLKAIDINKNEIFNGIDNSNKAFIVQLNRPGQTIDQNILYFKPLESLSLPVARFKMDINTVAKNYNIIVKSEVLLKNVVFRTRKAETVFSENNIDIIPGKRTKVSVIFNGTQQELEKELKIQYLNPSIN
jgi:hypothetical protein